MVVFPPLPDRTRAVEMLAVEPGTTPIGPATLLSVLLPKGSTRVRTGSRWRRWETTGR